MELLDDVQDALERFDETDSGSMVKTLRQVKSQLRSDITREYLEGKIQAVQNASTESEKKSLCRALVPYLEWYLQGK